MFKEISFSEIFLNPFDRIQKGWFLLTAGSQNQYNTMTCSEGMVGMFDAKPAMNVFVLPTRYTYEFLEKYEDFTISFFDESYRKALLFCGQYSGKDVDKIQLTGLTPILLSGAMSFEQAQLVFVCKKRYCQQIVKENYCGENPSNHSNLPVSFIGEIIKAYEIMNQNAEK